MGSINQELKCATGRWMLRSLYITLPLQVSTVNQPAVAVCKSSEPGLITSFKRCAAVEDSDHCINADGSVARTRCSVKAMTAWSTSGRTASGGSVRGHWTVNWSGPAPSQSKNAICPAFTTATSQLPAAARSSKLDAPPATKICFSGKN